MSPPEADGSGGRGRRGGKLCSAEAIGSRDPALIEAKLLELIASGAGEEFENCWAGEGVMDRVGGRELGNEEGVGREGVGEGEGMRLMMWPLEQHMR